MKYPVLSLILLSVATPALAHVEATPHVHGHDGAIWIAALIMAAAVAVGIYRNGN